MMNTHGNSQIEGVGYYLPEQKVKTSDMLDEIGVDKFMIDTSYIKDNVGVDEVRHSNADLKPSDMAIPAAEKALAYSDVNPDEIDLIIFCGIEGDYVEPSTAHIIQDKLGLKSSLCVDIQNACLGFMSAVVFADSMIGSGAARKALVVTGERTSRVSKITIDDLKKTSDRSDLKFRVGMLAVGDAGGAVILGPKRDKGFLSFTTRSEGKYASACYYKNTPNGIEGHMHMGKICTLVRNSHVKIYEDSMKKVGWTAKDVDCLITHQVGDRAFEIYSDIMHIPQEKMTKTYDYLGNITTATFPVNLGIAMEEKRIKPGTNVFAAMSGSGISVAHAGFTI